MRLNSKRRRRARKTLCLLAGVSAGVAVQANPQAPTIAAGHVSFANPNATTLEIANSPNAIINWQSFDIGVGETTRFVQQSAASAVLNRVTTQNPSDILGNLVSNGRVFLVNPAGIVIGRDGLIDTAGLVLSTLSISNENFLAGRYEFNGDAGSGQIANHGYIKTTPGGEIVLLAPRILNAPEAGNEKSGIIESENGELVLASGYSITITSLDDPDISFEVTAPAGEVVNLGQLIARGGSVEVLAETIHHSGEINADALSVDAAGRIVLTATKHIETTATSVISARGERAVDPAAAPDPDAPVNPLGAAGGSVALKVAAPAAEETDATTTPVPTTATLAGRIDVTGARGGVARVEADTVTVRGTIDASGKTGGGTVQVLGDTVKAQGAILRANADVGDGGDIRFGGEFRGADTLRAADSASVDGASRFEANAMARGDGGEVVIWSDLTTVFAGKVEARGGLEAGDGGMIEVSGKETLQFSGGADVGAPRGEAGTLLLDPRNIRIVQGGATVSVDNPTPFAGDQFGSSFQVLANGNILVLNQNADIAGGANAGEITLISSSGTIITSLSGASANQNLGAFGFFSLNNNLILIRDPNAANGAAAQAGALIALDTNTGAVVATTRGNSANEQLGSNFAGSFTDSYVFSSTSADIGGIGADVGIVSIISRNTGFELGRIAGQSANEAFGSSITFLSGGSFLVRSALADVGAATDAGAVVLVNASTGQEIGRVSGAATGDQFGATVDTSNVPVNTYLIRSASADVGGLTDNGTAVLVNRTTGLEIGRTSGLANSDNLGSFAPIFDGTQYWLQVPNADVGANVNAGSLVLVNGTTGQRIASADGISANELFSQNGVSLFNPNLVVVASPLADTAGGVDAGAVVGINRTTGLISGRVDGTSAGENLGAQPIVLRGNGNYFIPSPLFDTGGGVVNAGSMILADGSTGNELGRFSGDTANEQFGSNRLDFSLSNGDILVMAPTHGNGAGIVVQLSATPISPGVIKRGLGVQGAGTGDAVGAIAPTFLSSGNYVVRAPNYTVLSNAGAGAVFVIDDATGLNAFAPIEGLQSGEGLGATVDFNLFGPGADRFAIRESGHGFNSEGAIFFVNGADGGGVIRQLDGNTSDALGSQPLFLTANGNVIVGNPNAGGNFGSVTLLDTANNFATIGSINGISAGERLGDFSIGSLNLSVRAAFGDFLIFSPQRTVGGKTNAGAVILASQTDLGGNVIFRADIEGAETDDFLGRDAAVQNLADGDFVIFNPDADYPLGPAGGTNDEGAIILASAAGAELGRTYGQSDDERLGDEFQVFESTTGNGNYFAASPDADPGAVSDAGSVYLLNGANGGLIGQANGDTANEHFGDVLDAFSLFATGDAIVLSSAGHAGGGTVVQLASSDLGSGNIIRGRIDGVAGGGTAEGLGAFGTQMTADGTHYYVRSPFADVGANVDAGSIYFVNAATGALANRLDGQSANEGFGAFGNTNIFNFGSNLFVSSRLADAGAVADAGRALVVAQSGSLVGQLTGNNANEQLGSVFQFVGNDIWLFAPLHNNGALTAAGAIFALANQDLGGTIVRASLMGTAAGDNLGAQGADFVSATTRFIRVPLADVAGMTDAGAAILVNTNLQEIGRTTGTSANEQFGSQSFTSLANGNLVFRSPLADVNGLVDAGVVKLVSRTTGTLIGQTAGTSANEQFGSSGIQSIGNNGYLVISTGADVGGLVDAGAVVQISQDTGLEIQRVVGISAGEQFGSFGYTPVGGRLIFRSPFADIGGVTDAGRLVFFDPTSANQGGSQSNVFFTTDASGDFIITTGAIANALNSGANLILESNNDIVVDFGAALTATGGKLSLRAGRSVVIKGLLDLPDTDIEITVGANQQGIDLQNRGSGASEFRMVDPQLVGKNVSISAELVTLTGGSTPSGTTPLPWQPIDAISFVKDFQLHGTAYPATFVLGLDSLKVTADTIALTGGDAPGAFAALISLGGFEVDAGTISLVPGTQPGAHAVFLGLGGEGNFKFDSCEGCGSTFLYSDPFLQAGAPVSGFFVTGLIQNLALDSILSMLDREEDEDTRKKRCN